MSCLLPVFDGHNDSLTRYAGLDPTGESFLSGNPKCRLDLPRAASGGFAGGFFAIFTDPPEGDPERDMKWGVTFTADGFQSRLRSEVDPAHCMRYTDQVIAYLRGIEEKSKGALRVVKGSKDLESTWTRGALAVILHIEGAECIKEDLSNLSDYYDQGVRSIGITWSRPNRFGCGVAFGCPASPDQGPGLTEAGKGLVRACNRMGITVDLAHLNLKGFFDVATVSVKPLVVSHSNAHALCPSARNLTDGQIEAVAASDGVIGVNFEPSMLRPDGKPGGRATVAMIADHVEYLVQRGGMDHVGLGSDFDGADTPEGMEDVAHLPALWPELERRGFSEKDRRKIAHGNWLRVLKKTLAG